MCLLVCEPELTCILLLTSPTLKLSFNLFLSFFLYKPPNWVCVKNNLNSFLSLSQRPITKYENQLNKFSYNMYCFTLFDYLPK